MSTNLTLRQQQVLQIIEESLETHGFPPSIREIQTALGVASVRGAVVHLEALAKKGYIQRQSTARGIKLLKKLPKHVKKLTPSKVKVPVVGRVAAGTPILAEQNIEKYISIKREYLRGNQNAFLLRVQGDSMRDAGIESGDLAIVIPTSVADNGDFVVALLEDEATLKKFHRVEDYVALLPANPEYAPIIGRDFSIQGKVIGVVRERDKPYGSVTRDGALLPIYKMRIRTEAKQVLSKWVYGSITE